MNDALARLLADARAVKRPRAIKPMLATRIAAPFDRLGWIFEPKWDGYRAIAELSPSGVRLYSRNQRSFETSFAAVVIALAELRHEVVLDSEVVAVDAGGRPRFQLFQRPKAMPPTPAKYWKPVLSKRTDF
jgi:bifunctional non-homologous end joining protein LigD